jgi:hypothetical protein
MLLRASSALLSGLCIGAFLAVPSVAQQTPPASPTSALPPCDAFKKNIEGDWVAKQDITVPGPTGPVQIKAGRPVDDDLQDELDDRCK